jgi:arabinofuranan 3-O-arabinosyltransferase
MGYWLNYVTEQGVAATSRATRYLTSPLTIFLTLAIPALGILGIALTRLLARRVTAWLVLVGAVLAVGVYPLLSASPLMYPIAQHQGSFLALALRSSTRAYPVLLLGIAFGVGALVQRILSMKVLERRPLGRLAVTALTSMLVFSAMPSLWTTGTTDPSLSREQSAPKAWQEAGSLIDEISGTSSRVLQLPGQEFGAYNWGFTVDPALPTVTDAPIITRDLLPLGQPQVMDLLFSLDDAAQNQTLGAGALSATAKKLGVSSLFVPQDLDTQRFMSADTTSLLADLDPGVSQLFSSGKSTTTVVKIAGSSVARTTNNAMVISGSGAGVVNAAQHGLVNDSLLRYSADMTP